MEKRNRLLTLDLLEHLITNIRNAVKTAIYESSLNELSRETVIKASNAVKKKFNNLDNYTKALSPNFLEKIKNMSKKLLQKYKEHQMHIILLEGNLNGAIKNVMHYYNLPISPEFLNTGYDSTNTTHYKKRKPTELEHLIYLAIYDTDKCTLKNKDEISKTLMNSFIDYLSGNEKKYEELTSSKKLL